jgi:hypothetical protein
MRAYVLGSHPNVCEYAQISLLSPNHMPKYTEEQKLEYIETAKEIGIGPAMRELGFPGSYHTAQNWLSEFGVEITKDSLQQRAVTLGIYYSTKEKVLAAQALLVRLLEKIEGTESLDAKDLVNLANAMQRVMQTLALIEGEATQRTETLTKDATDVELVEMLNEAKAKNDAFMQTLDASDQ